ncbi:related to Nonsense-mediated mRNA decay protein 5 [Saccharomycodes ludwigii]|uniref:Related to Nonsense-mediated mRNA decay protein 5 n=1 Tax=Saccharomycodes ludwigii TaxID=36035 RepID=A0A376B9Q5_9ASCO|nr:related to Nonsense-mediated mRNA decay protein 5 [Saccharomycodes ludwigii]
MDTAVLLQCFASTLHQDLTTRSNAEQQLKQISKIPGFLGSCLDIIGSGTEIPESIKLAASLYFKNKILYGWTGSNLSKNELLSFTVDNDEKPIVKDMFIEALVSCSNVAPNCLRLLQPALNLIVSVEYPHKKWDNILPISIELLNSNNLNSMYVGLLCLSEILRTYRWIENDSRQSLETIIHNYFDSLLDLGNNLFQSDSNMEDPKIGEMCKLILKCFKFVTYMDLPFTLQRPENFIPWANFHVSIIQAPVSMDFLEKSKTDLRSRSSYPWFKAKKWAYSNLGRLFERYASRSLTKKFSYEDFRRLYTKDFLPHLLNLYFQQLEQWHNKALWLSNESLFYILGFIEHCVCQKSTWPLVKPHYHILLETIIASILCPSEEILEVFENDPQEYIHRYLEVWNDDYSPDLSAISLLTTVVSKKPKTTLQPTLEFVTNTLNENFGSCSSNGDISTLPLINAVQIESCFRIFSTIVHQLTSKNSPYLDQIEIFLPNFVFPLFQSKHGFLRARVCEIVSKLNEMNFGREATLTTIFHGILVCFNESDDDSVPVTLLSALAIQAYLPNEQFQQILSTMVLPIMQKLLKISNEVENDSIGGVLQEFVESFAEQLQPFGVELMNNLVQQFLKLAIELNDAANFDIAKVDPSELPVDSNKQMTALSILSTIISILLSFENSKEIVKNLEQSFYPAAEFILQNNMEDFYREVCEFFENSCFLIRDITPISWKVLELIGQNNRQEGSTVSFYLEDFMLALNNYLVFGQEELKKNNFYSEILFKIYERAMDNEDIDFDEVSTVYDLATKIMISLNQSVPPIYYEKFLTDAVQSIKNEENELSKRIIFGVNAFSVILSCLVNFTVTTLQYLENQNILKLFLETWFTVYIPKYTRVFDVKLSCMAIFRMLDDFQNVNEFFQSINLSNFMPELGSKLVILMERYPYVLRELEKKRKEFSFDELAAENTDDLIPSSWDDQAFEDEGEEYDEENTIDITSSSEKYIEFLEKEASTMSVVHNGAELEGESFDDLEEDPLSANILDNFDLYGNFKSVVQSTQPYHQVIFSQLNASDQKYILDLMNL